MATSRTSTTLAPLRPEGSPPRRSPLLARHPGHTQLVHGVAALPDGARYLSASEDRTMTLRAMDGGARLRRFRAHAMPVNHLVLSPSGHRLITGSDDGTVRIWSTTSWRTLQVLRGHTHYVRQVAATDRLVLSGAQDAQVRLWDMRRGTCLQVLADHAQDVLAVAISADGRLAASSSKDNALFLWDLERGQRRAVLYESGSTALDIGMGNLYISAPNLSGRGHRDAPRSLAFTEDGRYLISVGQELILWDLERGEEVRRYPPLGWPVQAVALLPGGRVAFGGRGVHVWQLRRGGRWLPEAEASWVTTLGAGQCKTESLGLTPRGDVLLLGQEDGAVDLYRTRLDRSPRGDHPDSVSTILRSPSSEVAAMASQAADGSVRLARDPGDAGAEPLAIDTQLRANGGPMAFTPEGRSLLLTGKTCLEVWEVASGERRRVIEGPLDERGYEILGLGAVDETRAVIGALGDGVALWDLTGGGEHRLLEGRTRQVSEVACTPDGRLALTRGYFAPEGQEDDWRASCEHLQCWDLRAGQLRWSAAALKLPGAQWHLNFGRLTPLPDGRRALTLSGRRRDHLALWDLEGGEVILEIAIGASWCSSVLLTGREAALVAVSSEGSAALLWLDLARGRVTRRLEVAGAREVQPLGPSGELVLSRTARELQLLDPTSPERPLSVFRSPEELRCLASSAEGRVVLAGDASGVVHRLRLRP